LQVVATNDRCGACALLSLLVLTRKHLLPRNASLKERLEVIP
jgi:hypothetical protein